MLSLGFHPEHLSTLSTLSTMPLNNTRDQLFRLTAFARCAG